VKPAAPTYSPLHPQVWSFLGDVAESWGLDWARVLRDNIASGDLGAPEQTVVTRALDAGATLEEAIFGVGDQ
jgi:hypothetical protein